MTDIDLLMQRGNVAWHSSDEDGGPDVGISVGLGAEMIYAGEVPGMTGPWSLVIYTGKDRRDIAQTVDQEAARDLIEKIGGIAKEQGGDNPIRRALDQRRKAEGCPEGVPLWLWQRMKREVREASLREAAMLIVRHEMGTPMHSPPQLLTEAHDRILALIPPPPPVFATEGAEDRWIADTKAGVYDEEPSSAELLVAALDAWMRDECDRIEVQIGRECRDRDLPAIWHKASVLRGLLGGKADD